MKGYAAIGLEQVKDPINVGSILRASSCFGASLVAFSGRRYRQALTDTTRAYRNIPLVHFENLRDAIPFACVPVAVEFAADAIPLAEYKHPERAFYVFGAEDNSLGKRIVSWCCDVVMIPTKECLNLACAVNIVLYDRAAKQQREET